MTRSLSSYLFSLWMDNLNVWHLGAKKTVYQGYVKLDHKEQEFVAAIVEKNELVGYAICELDEQDGGPITPWKYYPHNVTMLKPNREDVPNTIVLDGINNVEFADIDHLLRHICLKRYFKMAGMITYRMIDVDAIDKVAQETERYAAEVRDLQWCTDGKEFNDPEAEIYIRCIIKILSKEGYREYEAFVDLNHQEVIIYGDKRYVANADQVVEAVRTLTQQTLGVQA